MCKVAWRTINRLHIKHQETALEKPHLHQVHILRSRRELKNNASENPFQSIQAPFYTTYTHVVKGCVILGKKRPMWAHATLYNKRGICFIFNLHILYVVKFRLVYIVQSYYKRYVVKCILWYLIIFWVKARENFKATICGNVVTARTMPFMFWDSIQFVFSCQPVCRPWGFHSTIKPNQSTERPALSPWPWRIWPKRSLWFAQDLLESKPRLRWRWLPW